MNGNFDDRLWNVVAATVSEEPTTAPRRRKATTAILLSLTVLASGLAIRQANEDQGQVRLVVPAQFEAHPADLDSTAFPVLTFGDPVGEVVRLPRAFQQQKWRIRESDSTEFPDVIIQPGFDDFFSSSPDFLKVAQAGTRELFAMNNTGGVPMGVYHWIEPDGTVWITTTEPGIPQKPPAVTSYPEFDQPAFDQILKVVAGLKFRDGAPVVSAPLRAIADLDASQIRWWIRDERYWLTALDNRELEAVPNAKPTLIGGKPGFVERSRIIWQPTGDTVLALAAVDGEFQSQAPIDESAALRVIEQLEASTLGEYEALPLWWGIAGVNVIVTSGIEGPVYSIFFENDEGNPWGGGSFTSTGIGRDGAAYPAAPGTKLQVWLSSSGKPVQVPPACAVEVEAPPAGMPPVTVHLDAICE